MHSIPSGHLKGISERLRTFKAAHHRICSHWSGVFPGSSLPSSFGNIYYIESAKHFGWSFYLPLLASARDCLSAGPVWHLNAFLIHLQPLACINARYYYMFKCFLAVGVTSCKQYVYFGHFAHSSTLQIQSKVSHSMNKWYLIVSTGTPIYIIANLTIGGQPRSRTGHWNGIIPDRNVLVRAAAIIHPGHILYL